MTSPTDPTDRSRPLSVRRATVFTAFAALLFAWLAYRIWGTYDELRHYGEGRTVMGELATWLCAATAVGYVTVSILLHRNVAWARTLVRGLILPGGLGALYLAYLGITHFQKISIPGGQLIFFGGLGVYWVLLCLQLLRKVEVKS